MDNAWLRDNSFSLIQTIGIVASLFFTSISLCRDLRARRISDQLTLNQQHRELWSEVNHRPELARALQPDFDPLKTPITLAEEQFLRLVFVHFQNGWLVIKEGSLTTVAALERDTSNFFKLPGPRFVWDQVKNTHDINFVTFVNKCIQF